MVNDSFFKNITVMYVEDDDVTRESVAEFLRDVLKEVYVTSNAPDAFDIFDAKNPDIVITDIELGEMNGFELTRAIKNISPQTPVIVISAYNTIEHAETANEIFVNKLLTKPISYEKLLEAIKESLQHGDVFSELGEGLEFLRFLMDENPRLIIEHTKSRATYINRTLLGKLGFKSFEEYEKSDYDFADFLRTNMGKKYEDYAKENWAFFINKNSTPIYLAKSIDSDEFSEFSAHSVEFFEGKKRIIFLKEV